MQRAVAAHGSAGSGAIRTAGFDTKLFFNSRQKLLHQKIFIANFSVMRIDVERGSSCRSCDQEFTQLFCLPEVFDEIPAAGMNEHLLVVAEAVKEIEDRKRA